MDNVQHNIIIKIDIVKSILNQFNIIHSVSVYLNETQFSNYHVDYMPYFCNPKNSQILKKSPK
jgi:hypothetical protein